jgi:hypothetical protein
MTLLTMPLQESDSDKLLSASLRELRRILSSFFPIQLNDEECAALAREALRGKAEAEFTVASLFDAAGHTARAIEWYDRAASRNYLPAMLQLTALR